MNDSSSEATPGDSKSAPQQSSKDSSGANAPTNVTPQGRRVTLGGGAALNNRRSSLGMAEALLGDTFGRRSSGFGDFDMNMMARRGSMDSTSAVLDAAIMDLTRRRLSMAMGGSDMNLGVAAAAAGMGGMDNFAGYGVAAAAVGMDPFGMAGMGGYGSAMSATSNQPAVGAGRRDSVGSQGQQIQDQQRELERRRNELEIQRQQLVAAMEERRHLMQQMQTKLAVGGGGMGVGGPSTKRGSLSLGGLGGFNHNSLPSHAASAAMPGTGGNSGWVVCKICNSKAFANREEALQHEALCMAERVNRRGSFGAGWRSSLDLLANTLDHPDIRRTSLGFGGLMGDSRRFSLSGTADVDAYVSATGTTMSNGPFSMMDEPISLSMSSDKDWLTPLHCFVRRHCVQVFTATDKDVATPSKGKRKPIQVGQVGIRCPHCHASSDEDSSKARERGSIYYPTSISSIYNATMNLLQRHLHSCTFAPQDIMRRYETLKADDARSGTSKKYWIESALSLGLVDTPNGIRHSALTPPPLPSISRQQESTGTFSTARRNSNDFFSTHSNAITNMPGEGAVSQENDHGLDGSMKSHDKSNMAGVSSDTNTSQGNASMGKGSATKNEQIANSSQLVSPQDEPYATGFSFNLLSQMQPCVFTEADRLGKRKGLPPGFPGLACRHCFGGYGSGRFFPSSIKTLSDTSKTLNVLHNHMMRCRKCPPEVRETLDSLRKTHDQERAKMKFGSQKAFFARIWDRLHYKDPTVNNKRKFQPSLAAVSNVATASRQQQPTPNFHPAMQGMLGMDALASMQHFGAFMDPNKRQKSCFSFSQVHFFAFSSNTTIRNMLSLSAHLQCTK